MTRSLSGIRVVDITASVAGPFATQILGDLGADVIKIERPDRGDDTRGWGPPFKGQTSVSFATLNRNKRSVALDLKAPAGLEVLERIVRGSDVVIQNLSHGALQRLGLTSARLEELNPRLITCSITGFGSRGPMAERRAYDPLLQAYGGLMSINGLEGGPPVRVPVSILDKGAGFWAVIGILDALLARAQSGRGASMEVSLLDTALNWIAPQLVGYLEAGSTPRRHGSGLAGICPYGAFACEDGYLVVAAANDGLWRRLCGTLEVPGLAERPEYLTNRDRVGNREVLEEVLSELFRQRTVAQWRERLDACGVPNAPVQTIDAVAGDEQVAASGIVQQVEHPVEGAISLVQAALLRDGAYPQARLAPPVLGQHSVEVLKEFGLEEEDVRRLAADGVVGIGSA